MKKRQLAFDKQGELRYNCIGIDTKWNSFSAFVPFNTININQQSKE